LTTVSLTSELRIRIEDEDSVKFATDAPLYTILSTAQLEACALLHNNYLTELERYKTDLVMTAAGVALTAIEANYTVLKAVNGIINVYAYFVASGSGKHASFIDVKNINVLDTDDFGGDSDNPRWYVRAGKLYIKVDDADYAESNLTCNVTYLQVPPTLTVSVDPLLGDAYRSILLDLAEEICWRKDEKKERSILARNSALAAIKVLNDKIDF
jgi:hypothetical protein